MNKDEVFIVALWYRKQLSQHRVVLQEGSNWQDALYSALRSQMLSTDSWSIARHLDPQQEKLLKLIRYLPRAHEDCIHCLLYIELPDEPGLQWKIRQIEEKDDE